MSIRIYHGYRISPAVDLVEFTGRLRAVMNPIRTRLDARMLMDRAITAVDGADARGEARPQDALFTAMIEFDEEQRTMDPARRGHDPHRFEVAFGYDPQTGRTLCLLYADQDEFTKAWEALPEVEPYGYWDNGDRPGLVTAAEWEERREAWERVRPGYTPLAECMLSFSLRPGPPYRRGMIDLIVPRGDEAAEAERRALLRSAAKTKRARARHLAVSLLTQEALRRAEQAAGPGGGKPDTWPILSRFLFTAPTDTDNYETVVDACEAALNDDVIDFIIDADESRGGARPLNLTSVHPAVTGHLNAASR